MFVNCRCLSSISCSILMMQLTELCHLPLNFPLMLPLSLFSPHLITIKIMLLLEPVGARCCFPTSTLYPDTLTCLRKLSQLRESIFQDTKILIASFVPGVNQPHSVLCSFSRRYWLSSGEEVLSRQQNLKAIILYFLFPFLEASPELSSIQTSGHRPTTKR